MVPQGDDHRRERRHPRRLTISSHEIQEAIEEPVAAIIDSVKVTLDSIPPELAADVMHRGIVLTGGGALLAGLDAAIATETGMPVRVAHDPLYSVVMGSGQCLEQFDLLRQVLDGGPE